MSEFCHLHCHSEYSLLDGMSRLEDMVLRAKALNQPAIALTDHGVMFGAIEFYRAAKKHGIKPIMGLEAYMALRTMESRKTDERRPFHMLLLAQNQTGYQNLLKLSSIGQLEGFYQKPRIDRERLAQHAEGVIATTGCLAAEVPRTLIREGERAAYEKLKWYLDVFGRERFFLELQGHDIPELRQVNNVLLNWSRKHEVGLIATNDVHYVNKSDADPHEVLLCMQTHDVLSNPKRMRITPHGSYYITSTQEMAQMFGHYPDALKNTIRIAEMCEVNLDPKGYHLPIFPVPEGYDAESYLRYLVEKGLVERYGEYRAKQDPVVRERIERELGIIHNMGFDTYFLIVWDLCLFAAREDIWWNVRGSGAGSVVAYTLRITNIDPIKNDLIFERFLNPHRVSMPDFDLDFPDDRRHRMIEYAVEKYGKDKCAAIITFGTLGAKAAVRDVGRTFGMTPTEVNGLAAMLPSTGKVKLKKVLFDESGLEEWPVEAASIREKYQQDKQIKKVLDTAMKLEGQTRHASTHAAGIVISDKPIVEYAPLHRATKGNDSGPINQVVQFDMNIVESIGLLKVDFLGLATLAVMRRACEHIAERHGRQLNLNTIPYERNPDDPEYDADLMEAYKLLQRGETVGVFQVESDGLRRVLQDMLPDQFEHIIAAISLYRPGPLEYIPTYIERMHGREEVAYHHDLQEPILKNTYGICVSGDAIVMDAQTGQRYRLDEVGALSDFMIQGVNQRWEPAVGHVTHWIDSGHKPVYEVTLRNGASIKVTEDHRLLTEEGWQPLKDIKVGNYIGTPPVLYGAEESQTAIDRRRLRVLAYLITNGSLANGTVVDFVSKNANLVEEYIRCVGVFENLRTSTLTQIRQVTRVSVAKEGGDYHDANSLLLWMRDLGFKHPPGSKPGGLRSHEKFVPPFVFELGTDEIRFFLASLWDCDGYMSKKFCHYKTTSPQLAEDVRTLLLRLGIQSTTYTASYQLERGDGSKEARTSYQVTVFDAKQLAELLQPDMISEKRSVKCTGVAQPTITREKFITELDATTSLSRRALQDIYGISRQHFTPKNRRQRRRISAHVVKPLTEHLDLPQTSRSLNVVWQEVLSIEPAGVEHVYDLTVEGLHNFVANQIIVHNCVYQEQIMRMASDIAGYSPGEADLMRRAVSKKKEKEIERHKHIFIEGASKNGVERSAAEKIYGDIEYFARYGFNKCLPGDVEVIDAATGRLIRVADLYEGHQTLEQTVTCNIDDLTLGAGYVSKVMDNGIKPVFKLTTALGRTIEATANHPFYTFDGWRNLSELKEDDLIAVPRSLPVEGKKEWPDHELIALGHLLAEGNLCHPYSVYFYSQDPVECDDYIKAAEQFDNVRCTSGWHKSTYSIYAARIDRKRPPGIVIWAKELGIWGKNARQKEIPAAVFELSNRQIGLLISRMWSGDGHINIKDRNVYYATSSERMASQLQHLLLRLGIISRLRTVNFPYKDGRIGYQLFVTGNDNLAAFSERIGSLMLNQEDRAALQALFLDDPASSGTKDIIPIAVKELVRRAKERKGVTWTQLRAECGVAPREFYPSNNPTKKGFTRQIIRRLADYFDDKALYNYANSDIYWDRIVSIEYVGEKQTYDLEVPGTHNFIANDIVVHNSHAADYAVITVQTAYLKAHYPVEYLCALLEVEFDDSAKVPVLINECRRLGIDVLPPDINASGKKFTIEANAKNARLAKNDYRRWAIRVGLGAIKNVGLTAVEQIIEEREKKGAFETLDQFCERVDLRSLNRRIVECLGKVGSFDDLVRPIVSDTPREVVTHKDVIDRMMGVSSSVHAAASIGQLSMFNMMAAATPKVSRTSVLMPLPKIGQIDPKKRLDNEKELLGIYISEHPLQQVASQVGKKITHFCSDITEALVEQSVVIAGLLVAPPRVITTKKGKPMAFIKLEDLEGQIEVVVFPRTYEQAKDLLIEDKILLVRGKVNLRNDSLSVLADQIKRYQAESIHHNGTDSESHVAKANTNGWHVNGTAASEPKPQQKPPVEQNSPSMLEEVQYHITLTMERTEDHQQDLQRLKRVMGALREHPGRNKIELQCIIPSGTMVKMDFPKLTITWNAVLKDIIDSQNMQYILKEITPSKKRRYRKRA